MITIGGRDTLERPTVAADVFPKGIGIFDLTELKWKDEYDAGAAEYDSPQAIKSWYEQGQVFYLELVIRKFAEFEAETSPKSSTTQGSRPSSLGHPPAVPPPTSRRKSRCLPV